MPEQALNLAGFNDDTAENILENRRRFLKLFPRESAAWALAGCWQVHGSDVRLVNNLVDAKPAEDARGDTVYCDAIVSNARGVLAGVKTADCVPILIGDPNTGAFAAVHAGWRGTLAEIATKALGRMTTEYKTRPQDVCVAIGPAAGACCYEVGTDVINAFRESFPSQDLFTETRAGHACIDLLRANREQLVAAGVDPAKDQHRAALHDVSHGSLFLLSTREECGGKGRAADVGHRKETKERVMGKG